MREIPGQWSEMSGITAHDWLLQWSKISDQGM